ncbi:MAG TPA: biotin/lipoyl-binding protein [Gammaproteobacteria bacterium]|nr:biotin/lipoyl-binding protein [Gammaproteobacteria bacterium]
MALVLGASACTDSAPQAGAATIPAGAAAIPVITQPARVEPMGIEIEAVGTTQANESVDVTSKASNTVTAIRFREGDEVDRGAVLVEMDAAQVRAALAEA